MSLYVLVLRGDDDQPDEVRYHDRLLQIGHLVKMGGRDWTVEILEDTAGRLFDPSGAEISGRYTCARVDRS